MAAWGPWEWRTIPVKQTVMGVNSYVPRGQKYWNRLYVAVLRACQMPDIWFGPTRPSSLLHLQIWRRDKKKVHSWTDLQRIKTEIVGAEAEGMELYPAESRVVNQAHVYHLWVVTGVRIPIGPKVRMVKGRAK